MVYGFVKQSGGHINIYSEGGHGTAVRIYLPRAGAQDRKDAGSPAAGALQGGSETIAVVEDDELVRRNVVAQLQSLGYRTLPAANAAAALTLIDSGARIDLLFTDVVMPGTMNGSQLAVEVVKRRPGIAVLFTSGYTQNAIMHQGHLDRGVFLLEKPYRKSDLARLVRAALAAVRV